ncbi:hypothetical protein T10_2526 [Trichinella papuae]|uniref:Uncharacterized protein n=1 Tax=Trichinella papuae TaxID=268474 RepID=A0A0V1MCP2_9BILA|nr:hypothetical protein T10_2526 [Trichinella papuae]
MWRSDKKRKRNIITSITCISFASGTDLEISNVYFVSHYCSYMVMDMKQQFEKRLAEIVKEKPVNKVIYSQATYDKIFFGSKQRARLLRVIITSRDHLNDSC